MQAAEQITSETYNESKFAKVSEFIEGAVGNGVFPGAVLLVGKDGKVEFEKSYGARTYASFKNEAVLPISTTTVFDIAAISAVFVTTTLMMKLVEEGKVSLTDRVARYIHGFGVFGKSAVTIGQLLSHCSGLSAWHPYFEELIRENAGSRMGILTSRGAREYILNSINRSQLKYEPGTKQLYSEIGPILLGELVEVLTGYPLEKAAYKYIFQPLGLKSTSYIDLALMKRKGLQPITDLIAPTEECLWRKRVICGEVHDDNAWAMGGIAGHSGVFTTASDLHLFASELSKAYWGQSKFLNSEVVGKFWLGDTEHGNDGWRYGWDAPSKENNMHLVDFGAQAVGINGFTGCSLWLVPERGLDIILLTNRIYPSRSNKKITSCRPQIYKLVMEAMKA